MAFEGLTEKLTNAFKKLRGKGRLTESDVKEAMREIRMALLEADVSYKVVKDFVARVSERAVGSDVLESLTPAQMIVKIVNEELTALMGGEEAKLNLSSKSPTIVMMVGMVILKMEFGSMKTHESNAVKGDLYTTPGRPYGLAKEELKETKGKVMDLLIPIVSLIICCVIGMLYTGEFFSGADFVTAFSQSDASLGLTFGSFFGLVITIGLYQVRRVLKFSECMACIPEGFKAMVPAILILTFAWTLKAMTDSLGADVYVAGLVESSAKGLLNFLPAIIFIVGCFLAFATGTSWGTFGILIPIVVAVFENSNPQLMIISISACMAGAVCGDHCSPISDTTIMASAGAQCEHVNHVMTQLPYAITAAVVSFITYIVAGFVQTAWIALPVGIVLMAGVIFVLKQMGNSVEEKEG